MLTHAKLFGVTLVVLLVVLLVVSAPFGGVHAGRSLDALGGPPTVAPDPAEVAATPGNSPMVFCGDVIDHRRNRLGPPPKPFTDDMDRALASLRRVAELEFDVLCPGHGAPLVGGADDQVRTMRALA